jgi:hypothetical protein
LLGLQLQCEKEEIKKLSSNMKLQLSSLNYFFLALDTKAKIKCKKFKDEIPL